ncbi:MAG: sugar-binding protein [Phycisphaerales bacterium]
MCGRTICSLVLILGLTGLAVAQDWDIEIPSVNKPPVLDGELDSIWSIASVQYIGTTIDGTATSPADCSGSWRVMWDSEYIYVIVDVNDEALFNDSGSAYLDDSVEFYFDGGNSKGAGTPLADNDRQYTFGWTATDIQGTNTNTAGVEQAQVTTPNGWRIEMRFPWLSLQGTAPAMGDLIGIDVFINDDDDGGDTREGQVATFGNDSGDWQVPSDWGTGVLVKGSSEKASGPNPANGATDVPREVVLGWVTGEFAAAHDVYFGTVRDDVGNADRANPLGVLVSQGQTPAQFDPEGLLEYGQTYYWRIDEVNGAPDNTVFDGEVWSFTTEPFAYPIAGPIVAKASSQQIASPAGRSCDGSGLNEFDEHSFEITDMWVANPGLPAWIQYTFDKEYKLYEAWVWNANSELELFMGFGAKDVVIQYSTDGENWTQLENVPQFAQGTGEETYAANNIVNFNGVTAKYVKLTINTTWGFTGITSLSEVRFYYIPVQAFGSDPADGATEVALDATLNWRPGREAASHQVYFGMDSTAVAEGTVAAETVTEHSYTPPAMDFGTVYYWKVDEVGDARTYEGDLWSFTSQEYAPIDDFESYTDNIDAQETIWHAWVDGVTTKASGSQVGYTNSPFAETSIVHGGRQSMPFAYNNATDFFFSEAERSFDPIQNWAGNGATELSLWIQGYPSVTAVEVVETSGKVNLTGAGTDIWNTSDEFTYAYKTLTGDGTLITRVVSNGTGSNTWAKGGVMIRDSIDGGAAQAMMAITGSGGNGASFQYRATADGASTAVDSTAVVAPPYWVKIERAADTLTGSVSADGKTWRQIGTTAIAMADPVLIGLAVTSHESGVDRTYQFDSIASTGAVTGAWQGAVVNSPQYNAAANLHVLVEDSAGKIATVTSATAVTEPKWTQWKIPMTDFPGVNFARVKKMAITIGDKDATTAGGTGIVFIDDIGFGHSAQ